MEFYWVNIKSSYKEVEEQHFLWAPSYYTAPKKQAGWRHVPNVKRGDVVFCYHHGYVSSVAVARCDAYEANAPASRGYKSWKGNGYRVDVELVELMEPIRIEAAKEALYERFNHVCEPALFTKKQKICQAYLIRLPQGAAACLSELAGSDFLAVVGKSQAQSSTSGDDVEETTRKAMAKLRKGQAKFRKHVLALWENTCPLTDINIPELLVASHIVPWALATNIEKLDQYNGIPLTPTADKLFDKGLISFEDNGSILLSNSLSLGEFKQLGLDIKRRVSGLQPQHMRYLSRHRQIFGFE